MLADGAEDFSEAWGYRGEYGASFHGRCGVGALKLRQSVDF